MGSDQGKEMGLKRGSDIWKESPDLFTVLGADIPAAELKKKFSKNEWARNVIDAIACARGQKAADVPESFWRRLAGGVIVPVQFVFLKEDDNGHPWRVIIAGQHRTIGLRKMNAELVKAGSAPLELPGNAARLPRDKTGIEAAVRALAIRTNENIRVPLRPSDRADLALKHSEAGMAIVDIAACVEVLTAGVDEKVYTKDVQALIALAECEPEVREAVDAGRLPIARCLGLATKSAEKQRAAVAPKEKGAPREQRRTLPGEFAKTWAEKLPTKYDAASAVLRFMSGDLTALDGYPSLKAAAEEAGLDFETGRVKRAEK